MWCAEVLSSLLVKRCNSALRWQNRGAPCCWVGLAMLCASFCLMTQRAVVGGKDDFQRTDGINMIFLWLQSYYFLVTFLWKSWANVAKRTVFLLFLSLSATNALFALQYLLCFSLIFPTLCRHVLHLFCENVRKYPLF